jgi:hypothetical protein
MGNFNFLTLVSYINAISSESSSSLRFFPFHTLYLNDPWNLPSLAMSYEFHSHIGMEMSFSVVEILYQDIQEDTSNPDPSSSQTEETDPTLEPIWVSHSSSSHDF